MVDYNKDLSEIYWDVAYGCRLPPTSELIQWRKDNWGEFKRAGERYGLRCGWILGCSDELLWSCVFMASLRHALRWAGRFEDLEKFAKCANTPTTQRTMASTSIRLASVRRATGNLCGRLFEVINCDPKSSFPSSTSNGPPLGPLGSFLLWAFLQFDTSDLLSKAEKTQAAAIGVHVELEQRNKNMYGPGRWECRAPKQWPRHVKANIRLEPFRRAVELGGVPQCCWHGPIHGQPPKMECKEGPLFLDLPEVDIMLKLEADPDGEAGSITIAVGDSQGLEK